MTRALGILDRLRIERLVWALDQQLYDLPRRTRIATRREVRANLVEAACEVGATEALRGIGGSRQLAQQYLVLRLERCRLPAERADLHRRERFGEQRRRCMDAADLRPLDRRNDRLRAAVAAAASSRWSHYAHLLGLNEAPLSAAG